MKRRDCLKAGLTLPLLPTLLKAGPAFAATGARVRPGSAAWPVAAETTLALGTERHAPK